MSEEALKGCYDAIDEIQRNDENQRIKIGTLMLWQCVVGDIADKDPAAVRASIEKVIAAFKDRMKPYAGNDEISATSQDMLHEFISSVKELDMP